MLIRIRKGDRLQESHELTPSPLSASQRGGKNSLVKRGQGDVKIAIFE